MENYSIIIFILAIVIGLPAFADKAKLPYPVLLVIVGISIGFIPTMTKIEINPIYNLWITVKLFIKF